MQASVIPLPVTLIRAWAIYDCMYYFAVPLYFVDRVAASVRDLFISQFVDYTRRVDAAWAVEVMSGITALVFAIWTVTGAINGATGNPSPVRAFEEFIPAPIWAIILLALAAWQIGQATWGERIQRAVGCCVAVVLWAFWIIMIWMRGGYAGSTNPMIALDFMCLGTCVAYYVSANPKNI